MPETLTKKQPKRPFQRLFIWLLVSWSVTAQAQSFAPISAPSNGRREQLNFIIVLTDDHRYDFMGFTEKVPWLETPHLDAMAKAGCWIKNATVTTALCSPSRASILTGQYAHTHQVVDNFSPIPPTLTFLPQYLQSIGYQTALIGKWHMGNTDDQPQRGFNHWESFKGQGVYYGPTLNENGKRIQYTDQTYITDLLTDHALTWIDQTSKDKKPFFLYLAHKGVHDEFMPAARHKGKYANKPIPYPSTINLTAHDRVLGDTNKAPTAHGAANLPNVNVKDIPNWVKAQRNSWHGVDFMYNGRVDFDEFYRRYAETLLSIDESLGKIRAHLRKTRLDENTVIIYMGDNGFMMGEHGLIDKRNMYEESQRIPMIIEAPQRILRSKELTEVIQNIDIAPTILDLAGIQAPTHMQGKSFAGLIEGKSTPWRNQAFYEYYWEYSYPQTPTTLGVRTEQYKFIFYPGIWDVSECFDLKNDPEEKNNLYRNPAMQPTIEMLRASLWQWLEQTGGMQIPLKKIQEKRLDYGNQGLY